jgi:non-specific serine/threonine protein kinase
VAEPLLEDGIALHEALGDHWGAAWAQCSLARCLGNRGTVTKDPGDFAQALPPLEESLGRFRTLGDIRFGAIAAIYLGITLLLLGETAPSAALLKEGLEGILSVGDQAYLLPSLITLALVAALTEQPVRAARLLGGAESVADAIGATLAPVNRVTWEKVLATIRPHLDQAALDEAQDAGRTMGLDLVMAEVWAVTNDAAAPRPAPATSTRTNRRRRANRK